MNSKEPRLPTLLKFYGKYLHNEITADFIQAVLSSYTVGTLERLAEHNDPNVRRAALMALGFLGDYSSNATVGRALTDIDRGVRLIAENNIRSLWMRVGTQEQRHRLEKIATKLKGKAFEESTQLATQLILEAPWYAEAYFLRSSAAMEQKDYERAIRDSHQALEINPYHFPAAMAMGQCYLKTGETIMALESFRRALRLNPNLEAVRTQVSYLERQLEEM
ncbi:MAG: hypothetical protein COA78_16010 [Blastopirellula sp.]|nr:MAG: hypothetical protein COA78_16010 [Blastopirellula sp.]